MRDGVRLPQGRAALAQPGRNLDCDGRQGDSAQAPGGIAGLVRRVAAACRQSSYQEAAGVGREPFHRLHRFGVPGVDMGESERHGRLTQPFRVLCSEFGTGFASPGEETVAVRRQIEQKCGCSRLAVVLFASRDYAVSGGGDPVRHAGMLPQCLHHPLEVRREVLGRVEDSELSFGALEFTAQRVRDRACIVSHANRRREGFGVVGRLHVWLEWFGLGAGHPDIG